MNRILVTFYLHDIDNTAAAYRVLSDLGLRVAVGGVFLPPMTMVGTWALGSGVEQIRDALLHALASAGIQPQSLLVTIFESAAWWGRPVKQQ